MNKTILKTLVACAAFAPLAPLPLDAETVVDVDVRGAQKITVAVNVAHPAFAKS